jgi:hypothetical protein
MLTAVGFDHELCPVAGEIDHERPQRHLPAKPPLWKIFSEETPHPPFGVGWIVSQASCRGD